MLCRESHVQATSMLRLSKNDFPHLRDLWFSDVCQTKEGLEIDLLIGADYLWEFQRGRTVRGKSKEPVAIETELGCVLSGPLKRRYEFSETGVQELSVNIISQESAGLDKASLDRKVS